MKYELTFEQLKEIILCAARNCLNDDEAIEYLQDVVGEMMEAEPIAAFGVSEAVQMKV